MFCKNCGSQIPDNTKFCGKCGAAVKQPTGQQQRPSGPYQNAINLLQDEKENALRPVDEETLCKVERIVEEIIG